MKITDKELNILIEQKVYKNHRLYNLLHKGVIVESNKTLIEAMQIVDFYPSNEALDYTVALIDNIPNYSGNVDTALKAIKSVVARCDPKENVGVLITYFPSEGWKATMGNIDDCIEVVDASNAARALCIVLLRFLGHEL